MSTDLGREIKVILDEYEVEVQKDVEQATKTAAQFGAKTLKETGPKDTGKYAKAWGYKKEGLGLGNTSYVVYNKKYPGLTHLLEDGHLIRNQYGTYGRTNPIPHIEPVEILVQEKLLDEITRRIRK